MEENNEKINEQIESKEKPLDPFIIKKMDNYKDIIQKLTDLINSIRGGQKIKENKTSIFEYILFPEIFPFDKMKEKIYVIFGKKNNEEIYNFLLEEMNYLLDKGKTERNCQELLLLRNEFHKMIEKLNYFISNSLIFFGDIIDEKDKAFELFKAFIIEDTSINKLILANYIHTFDLYSFLKNYYSINRQDLLSVKDINKILYLIDILKLQNISDFNYNSIYKKRTIIFPDIEKFTQKLLETYCTSLSELYELTNFILSFKKNIFSSDSIERILNSNKIMNHIDKGVKQLLIENLMINYSAVNNKKYKPKELLTYFIIIINNINILSQDYIIDWNILNKVIKGYIKEKEYDKIIYFLKNVKDYDIIIKNVNNEYIDSLIKSLSFEKIIPLLDLIKYNKEWIDYLIKNNEMKNKIKIVKLMNLKQGEYDEVFDDITMEKFFYYKANECFNDSFDILLDFALINDRTFNKCFIKLIKIMNKSIQNSKNKETEDADALPLDEEEEENKNKEKINENNFKDIMNFFLKEDTIKKVDEAELLKIKKEKIVTLVHFGKLKGFNLSDKNQKIFDKEFSDMDILNVDFTKYIPEDKCQPHDPSCYQINLRSTKIIFVDSAKILNENIKYFRKSQYVGIDSEWSTTSFNVNSQESASILQISNYYQNRVLIIDLLKMKEDKEFFDLFKTSFKCKIFIGYAFNQSDIEQFFEEMQNMFKYAEIIDLVDLYQNKFMEKAPSLKNMSEKIVGKKMCKYEQCSNWENRPLKKSQLHYAALDAIICISIYKILCNKS